jgi:hypothetical protein
VLARSRITLGGFVLIAVLGATAVNPSWAVALGVDVWNLPRLREQVRTAVEHERELQCEYVEVRHRIDAKEELINRLIDGRTTLAEVAAQFTVLNEGFHHELSVIRQIYPGATDGEKMLWNVVDYSQQRIHHLPVWHRFAILARLQAELHSLSSEFAAVHAN